MKSFKGLLINAGIAILMVVSSCKKEISGSSASIIIPPPGQSHLSVFLTDDQSLVFDAIFIDIRVLEAKVESAGGAEHWDTLSIHPGIYDILRFRNGVDTLFAAGFVANGTIEDIRLTLGANNSVRLNGSSFPLALHNNENHVNIQVNDIDSIDPAHFRLWLDFNGHGSVVEVHHNQFELNPDIHEFSPGHSQELEGRVRPQDAVPAIVSVISGSDTIRAVTENNGQFKFQGLTFNTVKVLIHPTNNYRDSLISNIILRQGDDTKLNDIVLHR